MERTELQLRQQLENHLRIAYLLKETIKNVKICSQNVLDKPDLESDTYAFNEGRIDVLEDFEKILAQLDKPILPV